MEMLRSAISAINKSGVLLVFPIKNQKQPASLWSHFFPRSQMRWEWDQDGDFRVSESWILREEISRSEKVVYAKWYQGRATFFSRPVFAALLSKTRQAPLDGLSDEAKLILEALEMNSPRVVQKTEKNLGLEGKDFESAYQKALKQLWMRLLDRRLRRSRRRGISLVEHRRDSAVIRRAVERGGDAHRRRKREAPGESVSYGLLVREVFAAHAYVFCRLQSGGEEARFQSKTHP